MQLMNTKLTWVGALGLGAALMFVLDPQTGYRRRTLLRDKMRRWSRNGAKRATAMVETTAVQARGIIAETQARLTEDYDDDETLTERVRSVIGRVVSHPRSLDVWVLDGHVTLCGPLLAQEVPALVHAVKSVRGVRGVEQRLDTQQRLDGVAGLRSDE